MSKQCKSTNKHTHTLKIYLIWCVVCAAPFLMKRHDPLLCKNEPLSCLQMLFFIVVCGEQYTICYYLMQAISFFICCVMRGRGTKCALLFFFFRLYSLGFVDSWEVYLCLIDGKLVADELNLFWIKNVVSMNILCCLTHRTIVSGQDPRCFHIVISFLVSCIKCVI